MKVLQKVREYIAVDVITAKKEAFKEVSMINGISGAEESLYIPPDQREINSQTILDGRGRLVSGEVEPEDYLQGNSHLIYPVVSTFWLIIVMFSAMVFRNSHGLSMGSDLSSIKDMVFSILNVDTKVALVLAVITYLHHKTTEKWFAFLLFALVEVSLVSVAMQNSMFVPSLIAFCFPGARLIYMNWKNRKDRIVRIKALSDNQLSTAGATNNISLNHIKILAMDETPVVSIAESNGDFSDNGFKEGVSKGLQISLSQNDMTRHLFVSGASGEGKSESMKQFLGRSLKVSTAKKAELAKQGKKMKSVGWAVFCGKADFPYDLINMLDGIVKPYGFDPIVNKVTGYKKVSLFKGLSPEKLTSTIVSVNGGGGKSKAGDNKIFDVTGESLTYRSAVALRFLKDWGPNVGIPNCKWAPSHLYKMFSALVKRKETKDANGNPSYVNDNDVLIGLRKILTYLKDLSKTNTDPQLDNNIKLLTMTIQFGENCLNDDIQKFIQSVVATSQSWISSLTENAQLLEWADTDEEESEIDFITEIMTQEKRYGVAMKVEEYGSASRLIQNLFMERLLTESAIRGKTWKDKDSKQNQVLLIIDEAQDILNESLVKNYAKKVRAWGLSMIIMTQNLSTLVDRFGKETVMGFVGDIANHIMFNPKDEFTLEYYMKRVGKFRLFKARSSSVAPYDFRHTAELALQKATFDNDNPYADGYKKLRTTLNFNIKTEKNDKKVGLNATSRGGWFGSIIGKFFSSIFGGTDQSNFVELSQYVKDEKGNPQVFAFDEIEQAKLTTKGQVLVIVERGIKRRVDLATMYTPRADN